MKLLLIILLLCIPVYAQKPKPKIPPKNETGMIFTSNGVPVLPIESGITLHRMKERVLYLDIKNTGTKPIKKVTCSVLITDIVTMKQLQAFSLITFEYALPVSPKETFRAILDDTQLYALKNEALTFGKCKDYKNSKDKDGSWSNTFIPDKCTQDAYVVLISSMEYSDGSQWFEPKIARVLNNAKKAAKESEGNKGILSSQLKKQTIKQLDFKESWIFSVGHGELACIDRAVMFITHYGIIYALNGAAVGLRIDGQVVSNYFDHLVWDKGKLPFFINLGIALCEK